MQNGSRPDLRAARNGVRGWTPTSAGALAVDDISLREPLGLSTLAIGGCRLYAVRLGSTLVHAASWAIAARAFGVEVGWPSVRLQLTTSAGVKGAV